VIGARVRKLQAIGILYALLAAQPCTSQAEHHNVRADRIVAVRGYQQLELGPSDRIILLDAEIVGTVGKQVAIAGRQPVGLGPGDPAAIGTACVSAGLRFEPLRVVVVLLLAGAGSHLAHRREDELPSGPLVRGQRSAIGSEGGGKADCPPRCFRPILRQPLVLGHEVGEAIAELSPEQAKPQGSSP
jgi:hypothetical protein